MDFDMFSSPLFPSDASSLLVWVLMRVVHSFRILRAGRFITVFVCLSIIRVIGG